MLKSKPELLPVLKNLRQIAVSMRTPSIPLPLPTFDTARKLAAAIGRAQRRLDSLTSAESTWGRIVVVDLKFEPMHLPGQQAKPDSNKLITSPIPMSAFRKNKDGSCVVGKESKQRWDLRFKWEQKGGCCLEIGALCRLQDGVQPKKPAGSTIGLDMVAVSPDVVLRVQDATVPGTGNWTKAIGGVCASNVSPAKTQAALQSGLLCVLTAHDITPGSSFRISKTVHSLHLDSYVLEDRHRLT